MGLEDVDVHPHRRVEPARVVEQALQREQALGPEADDRDAQRAVRVRLRRRVYAKLDGDGISPSPMRFASCAGPQPSSRSTQPSS